jgi:hypothetical protein
MIFVVLTTYSWQRCQKKSESLFMRHHIEWGYTLPWPWPGDPPGIIEVIYAIKIDGNKVSQN